MSFDSIEDIDLDTVEISKYLFSIFRQKAGIIGSLKVQDLILPDIIDSEAKLDPSAFLMICNITYAFQDLIRGKENSLANLIKTAEKCEEIIIQSKHCTSYRRLVDGYAEFIALVSADIICRNKEMPATQAVFIRDQYLQLASIFEKVDSERKAVRQGMFSSK